MFLKKYFKNKTPLATIFLFFIFSILTLFPFLVDPHIFRQNDMGAIFVNLYLKEQILEGQIPLWNFYVNQGIPVFGDPLLNLFNPLMFFSILLFPVGIGVKILYFFCSFFSGISMYLLLRNLKVEKQISLILSLTYMTGGFLASRIVAAHIGFILSYPIFPLVLLSIIGFTKSSKKIWILILAGSLSLIYLSGDLYSLFYALVLYLLGGLFVLFKKPDKFILYVFSFLLFIGMTAIKTIPIIEAAPYLYKVKEPLEGSMNITSIVYYLFLPVKFIFKIFGLSGTLVTNFAWWEKVSFIGPLPLLILIFYFLKRREFKIPHEFIFLGILFCLLLILTPGFSLNPYKFFVEKTEVLQAFHVPSRAFFPLTVVLLVITGLVLHQIKNVLPKKLSRLPLALLILNLILTFTFFEYVLIKRKQPVIDLTPSQLLKETKQKDSEVYYVSERLSLGIASFQENIKIKQKNIQNYPFLVKDSPAVNHVTYDFENKKYVDITPKYAVLPKNILLKDFNGKPFISSEKYTVYKLENYTPYAYLESEKKYINSLKLENNKINLKFKSNENDKLTLLESSMPGWQAYVDGKKTKLLNNRFLQLRTKEGDHTYEFVYESSSALLGGIISLASFILFFFSFSNRFLKEK